MCKRVSQAKIKVLAMLCSILEFRGRIDSLPFPAFGGCSHPLPPSSGLAVSSSLCLSSIVTPSLSSAFLPLLRTGNCTSHPQIIQDNLPILKSSKLTTLILLCLVTYHSQRFWGWDADICVSVVEAIALPTTAYVVSVFHLERTSTKVKIENKISPLLASGTTQ